ncbi:hypothetical protein Tco_1316509 [Tanacetum coccineum]
MKENRASKFQYKQLSKRASEVKMNDPNITMEEYIRLEEEKARRCGKVYNWETAMYGLVKEKSTNVGGESTKSGDTKVLES